MKHLSVLVLLVLVFSVIPAQASSPKQATNPCLAFMQHSEKKLHASEMLDLCQLTAGKPILIVNTASHCGFTPQFTALEAIHKEYQAQGLVVIGFPSDDFFQEEDDEKDTANICFVNYGVTFTMLAPVHVWGSNAHPIFKYLAERSTAPKWNFYKYLISANGKSVQHFNSRVSPDSAAFIDAINDIL
ncbi:glutathione peroxidase [Colwellia chukchiensis]|uniref:Glutathione peroxidase n=1 Tax=Colwellia chukchiensis TaxID=641665 RepID=A0A1H7HX46_9GAMM|nr:glutathione peroxidase [Colwellia chukchiensis]SEK54851.1 glutathione peroxidase [Colwellia chukchiensis]